MAEAMGISANNMNRNILEESNDQDEREIEKYFFNDLNFFAGIADFIIQQKVQKSHIKSRPKSRH